MLDFVDEAFDQMPLFVEVSIVGNCARPAGVGRDHGRQVALGQMRAKPARIESFVAKEILGWETSDQPVDDLKGSLYHFRAESQPGHVRDTHFRPNG
jgi:hypothetical protein